MLNRTTFTYLISACGHAKPRSPSRRAPGKSGVLGVSFDRRHGKWHARVSFKDARTVDGIWKVKRPAAYSLGRFPTKEDAVEARRIAMLLVTANPGDADEIAVRRKIAEDWLAEKLHTPPVTAPVTPARLDPDVAAFGAS
jgi:hypothetical protein